MSTESSLPRCRGCIIVFGKKCGEGWQWRTRAQTAASAKPAAAVIVQLYGNFPCGESWSEKTAPRSTLCAQSVRQSNYVSASCSSWIYIYIYIHIYIYIRQSSAVAIFLSHHIAAYVVLVDFQRAIAEKKERNASADCVSSRECWRETHRRKHTYREERRRFTAIQ